MIDLNTLVSNALIAAVQQAVAPLNERIATLELQRGEMQRTIVVYSERISALENNPAQGVDSTLERRVAALESETQGENRYLNRDDVAELIAEAMDEHTSNYDHDHYDEVASKVYETDFDEFMTSDNFNDAINEALESATIRISI
jgi:hypothetical protein